jgi:hypothetical protein
LKVDESCGDGLPVLIGHREINLSVPWRRLLRLSYAEGRTR